MADTARRAAMLAAFLVLAPLAVFLAAVFPPLAAVAFWAALRPASK